MKMVSKVLIGSALALTIAVPLFAHEEKTLEERNVYLFTPDGRMISRSVDEQKAALIMRNFQKLDTAMMAYASAGALYVIRDKKLDNGKMLSVEIFERDLGIAAQH